MATNAKVLQYLLFVAVGNVVLIAAHPDSCDNSADHNGLSHRSLLQAWNRDTKSSDLGEPSQQQAPPGTAKSTLPPELYQKGLIIMGNEQLLDVVVANTATAKIPYGGVDMSCRMVNGDGVDADDVYGVDSLDQILDKNGMMNMLDIGGNYGRVSMAAFKRNPQKMRVIVVEPAPSTYFLLKWNLFLNNVPDLTWEQFSTGITPGVYALQNGIGAVEGETKGLCYKPPFTMMSRMCDCAQAPTDGSQCSPMIGRTIESLFNMFGPEQPLSFVKMDCEGCEINAMPAIAKLANTTGRKIGRFGGELHAKGNDLEDMACKFEDGKWLVHVCWKPNTKKYDLENLKDRCLKGPSRESCSDESSR
mmetsp:Transcript_124178/g.218645  ORF Transcript_124178/g.218645 Transcript_124178/m.218645 type:complete len:361 (-) Transcript_124178:75-1157(-)